MLPVITSNFKDKGKMKELNREVQITIRNLKELTQAIKKLKVNVDKLVISQAKKKNIKAVKAKQTKKTISNKIISMKSTKTTASDTVIGMETNFKLKYAEKYNLY